MAGEAIQTRFGKLLVAESAFRGGRPLEEGIAEAWHREGENGTPRRFSGAELIAYFSMGVSGYLKEVKPRDEVETGLGKVVCRCVESTGSGKLRPARGRSAKEAGDEEQEVKALPERGLVYRAWLSDDVPFGVARFEVWAKIDGDATRPVFEARVVRTGSAAPSTKWKLPERKP